MKGFAFKDQSSPDACISKWIVFIFIIPFFISCSGISAKEINKSDSKTGIANPASVNCINKGGTLSIQKRSDGGEYGICIFKDNRQCEEWALFRGDCPVGGRKVKGYATPAAQYCVIAGGSYKATAQNNTDNEQGTCTFNNGKSCDAWDYYSGRCSKNN